MRHIKYILFLFFLFFISWKATPQASNLGDYPVRHFSKRDYHAGTQNWDIVQDLKGLLYFANNEGVLRFDGVHWDLFPVRNKTIVRSLYAHPDGRIFAGAQNELGYFFPSANGVLTYHSLQHLIPPANNLLPMSGIWLTTKATSGFEPTKPFIDMMATPSSASIPKRLFKPFSPPPMVSFSKVTGADYSS